MSIATAAHHFGAAHQMAVVGFGLDVFVYGRLPETGPARSGVELMIGTEQLGTTAHAAVYALVVVIPQCAGKSGLGAFLTGDAILLRRQSLLPFLFILAYFISHVRSRHDQ